MSWELIPMEDEKRTTRRLYRAVWIIFIALFVLLVFIPAIVGQMQAA